MQNINVRPLRHTVLLSKFAIFKALLEVGHDVGRRVATRGYV